MKSINIIGGGKVGKSLGRLFLEKRLLTVGDVVNRSRENAEGAVAFLGSGRAATIEECRPAELYLVSTPDDRLEAVAEALRESRVLRPGDIVFHTSGARSSAVFSALRSLGVGVAGVHPVKSFAEPESAVLSFPGTFCAVEGDDEATGILTELFTEIGGNCFRLDSQNKMLYHAASVTVCNYLTALLEVGLELFKHAEIERPTALRLMEPLVRETVDNVFLLGPQDALTGPIARGDFALVSAQLAEVSKHNERAGELYRLLGQVALRLSREKGNVSVEALAELERVLGEPA